MTSKVVKISHFLYFSSVVKFSYLAKIGSKWSRNRPK